MCFSIKKELCIVCRQLEINCSNIFNIPNLRFPITRYSPGPKEKTHLTSELDQRITTYKNKHISNDARKEHKE